VENLSFKTLTWRQGGTLTKPFCVEEVKQAVWDCDNYKMPRLDGINFGFIKDFWESSKTILCDLFLNFIGTGNYQKVLIVLSSHLFLRWKAFNGCHNFGLSL